MERGGRSHSPTSAICTKGTRTGLRRKRTGSSGAQAIRNHYLGIEVDLLVARMFRREVIAHLPSQFELRGRDLAKWLSDRLGSALRDEARASL